MDSCLAEAYRTFMARHDLGRTCDYLGVCVSYVAALKLRNYSWTGSE